MTLRNALLRQLAQRYPFRRGRTRVSNFAKRRVEGYTLAYDQAGHRMLLDLDQYIDSHLYIDGAYEQDCLSVFADTAVEFGATRFFDIGANLGIYTLHFAELPGIEEIHCFEPDPRTFAQLLANLLLAGLTDRVLAHCVALSALDEPAGTLYLSRSRSSHEMDKSAAGTTSLVFDERRHSDGRVRRVPMRRLDGLVQMQNETLAIKIDVEGHELSVLQGMGQLLRHNRAVIMVESFPHGCAGVRRSLEAAGLQLRHRFSGADNYLYVPQR